MHMSFHWVSNTEISEAKSLPSGTITQSIFLTDKQGTHEVALFLAEGAIPLIPICEDKRG